MIQRTLFGYSGREQIISEYPTIHEFAGPVTPETIGNIDKYILEDEAKITEEILKKDYPEILKYPVVRIVVDYKVFIPSRIFRKIDSYEINNTRKSFSKTLGKAG